jgi:hypothetical protein
MPAAMFITLNILDAYLTKTALAVGAAEFNPVVTPFGSSLLAKGLIAMAVVFVLYYFGKERALCPLNLALLAVVLWNAAICCMVTFTPSGYVMAGA